MKDTFTSDNRRDFHQRYNHCFAWFIPDSGDKRLVYITRVNEDNVRFTTEEGMDYTAYADQGITWEFTQLERGWYASSNGQAHYVSRIPQKQYSRGISNANTSAYTLADRILRNVDVSFNVVKDVCSSLSSTEDNIVVLSKHFAMNTKDVYMYDKIVGSRKKNIITMINPVFQQEMIDAVKRSGKQYEVVNVG